MKLLTLFTLLIISVAAYGEATDSLTYADKYGKFHTIAKDSYVNHASCIVEKEHVCVDNSCHKEDCGCPACKNDESNIAFLWVMGGLFGFMMLVLIFFAIQNGMFSLKRL